MARFINFECGAQGGNSDSDFEDGEDDGWRPRKKERPRCREGERGKE